MPKPMMIKQRHEMQNISSNSAVCSHRISPPPLPRSRWGRTISVTIPHYVCPADWGAQERRHSSDRIILRQVRGGKRILPRCEILFVYLLGLRIAGTLENLSVGPVGIPVYY